MGTRTPHGWALANIQHSELDGCGICHQTHLSTQGIYLTYNLAFGDTANCGIARHLCNLVHVHRDEAGLCTHIGTGTSCLATCVPTSNHQDIIIEFHPTFDNFPQK